MTILTIFTVIAEVVSHCLIVSNISGVKSHGMSLTQVTSVKITCPTEVFCVCTATHLL